MSNVEQVDVSSGGLRFNPSRLTLARRRRALTKVAFAARVDLTPRRIAAFENEGEVPPEATVALLAKELHFPLEFFSRPTPPDPAYEGASFRSFSRLPAGRREAALAAAALAMELSEWIDQRFRLPAVDIPELRGVDPATAALATRSAWALGEQPVPNIIHLLEAHGVRVYSLVEDCAALDGLSLWYESSPFVFLTRHKSPERGRWDAAHELGHLVLHTGGPAQGRKQEDEADAFAAEFLLPQQGFRDSVPQYPSLTDVKTEKVYWKVSAFAYIRRLHQASLITDRRYRSLIIEASSAGYRRQEGDIDRETSQLIPKVLNMLREDGFTTAEIAAELAIEASEVRGLLFSPLAAIQGGGSGRPSGPTSRHLRVL